MWPWGHAAVAYLTYVALVRLRGHEQRLWPLLPAPPYPNDSSFVQHFLAFTLDPYVLFQFALFAVAVAVWLRSGAPGFGTGHRSVRKWLQQYSPDIQRY